MARVWGFAFAFVRLQIDTISQNSHRLLIHFPHTQYTQPHRWIRLPHTHVVLSSPSQSLKAARIVSSLHWIRIHIACLWIDKKEILAYNGAKWVDFMENLLCLWWCDTRYYRNVIGSCIFGKQRTTRWTNINRLFTFRSTTGYWTWANSLCAHKSGSNHSRKWILSLPVHLSKLKCNRRATVEQRSKRIVFMLQDEQKIWNMFIRMWYCEPLAWKVL